MSAPRKLTIDQLDALLALGVEMDVLPDGRVKLKSEPAARLVPIEGAGGEKHLVNPALVGAILCGTPSAQSAGTEIMFSASAIGTLHVRGSVAEVAAKLGFEVAP